LAKFSTHFQSLKHLGTDFLTLSDMPFVPIRSALTEYSKLQRLQDLVDSITPCVSKLSVYPTVAIAPVRQSPSGFVFQITDIYNVLYEWIFLKVFVYSFHI
jgi:hypothetical protein